MPSRRITDYLGRVVGNAYPSVAVVAVAQDPASVLADVHWHKSVPVVHVGILSTEAVRSPNGNLVRCLVKRLARHIPQGASPSPEVSFGGGSGKGPVDSLVRTQGWGTWSRLYPTARSRSVYASLVFVCVCVRLYPSLDFTFLYIY